MFSKLNTLVHDMTPWGHTYTAESLTEVGANTVGPAAVPALSLADSERGLETRLRRQHDVEQASGLVVRLAEDVQVVLARVVLLSGHAEPGSEGVVGRAILPGQVQGLHTQPVCLE